MNKQMTFPLGSPGQKVTQRPKQHQLLQSGSENSSKPAHEPSSMPIPKLAVQIMKELAWDEEAKCVKLVLK